VLNENLEAVPIQPSETDGIEQLQPNGLAMNLSLEQVASSSKTAVAPSECASCGGGGSPQIVYALGKLGYDFGSQARLDSFI